MISTKYFQNTANFMLFIICIFLHSIFKTCIIKHTSYSAFCWLKYRILKYRSRVLMLYQPPWSVIY